MIVTKSFNLCSIGQLPTRLLYVIQSTLRQHLKMELLYPKETVLNSQLRKVYLDELLEKTLILT